MQSIRDFIIHTRLSQQANVTAFAHVLELIANKAAFFSRNEDFKSLLNAQHLNSLQSVYAPNLAYRFVDQNSMQDDRYYEEIIFQDRCIPTRKGSLHDYFNALIWLRYGHTKRYLNALHWQDISVLGHQRRTPVRDRITHFDECGLVLISDIPDLKHRLAAHDWDWLFVENKHRWFAPEGGIMPLHFGHANLEMLCQPFIGLTAKAYIIEDPDLLQLAVSCHHAVQPLRQITLAYEQIDLKLVDGIKADSLFQQKGGLLPLPILGIPGWHNFPQDADFYANKNYFMAHPTKR